MGTTWSAQLRPIEGSTEDWQAVLQAELDEIEAALTTYRDSSALMQLNAAPANQWLELGEHERLCLQVARSVAEASSGSFDPTVQALVLLWGFSYERESAWPEQHQVDAARQRSGWQKFEIRPDGRFRKQNDGLHLDLSAVGKGYAADRLSHILLDAGCPGALIEVGGELLVFGSRDADSAWRIGLEGRSAHPLASRKVDYRLELGVDSEFRAVATSGVERNFREHQGKLYSHVIDPRTGWPVSHRTVSVTVLAHDCASADAWATALLVLGSEAGLQLAAEQGIEARFIALDEQGNELEFRTAGFPDDIQSADD